MLVAIAALAADLLHTLLSLLDELGLKQAQLKTINKSVEGQLRLKPILLTDFGSSLNFGPRGSFHRSISLMPVVLSNATSLTLPSAL